MFTGIIEEIGTVADLKRTKTSAQLTIHCSTVLSDLALGDSISTNGVCLTVSAFKANSFTADIMNETLQSSSLGALSLGDSVNLERAMLIGNRFGGHIVSGHIDAAGRISHRKQEQGATLITVEIPEHLMKYIIKKGSITLDGISLTAADVGHNSVTVSIVAHTKQSTTLTRKKTGDLVNIECDIIGKYIETLLSAQQKDKNTSACTLEYLRKYGFA